MCMVVRSCANVHVAALGRTRTRMSPDGTCDGLSRDNSMTMARRRRRIRFRTTAGPTATGMEYPIRGVPSWSLTCRITAPRPTRRPSVVSVRNVPRPRNLSGRVRFGFGRSAIVRTNPGRTRSARNMRRGDKQSGAGQTRSQRAAYRRQALSLERPLARRAFRTARPPAVAIRARKPCFLDRRRLLG